MIKLKPIEKDFLVETANIAAGHFCTILSNMLKKKINQKVSNLAGIVHIKNIPKLIAEKERLVICPKKMAVAIYAPLKGDFTGNVVTLFTKDDATALLDLIHKKKPQTTKMLGEKELLTLQELGDSILSTYIEQMTNLLGLKIKSGSSAVIGSFGEHVMDFALFGVGINQKYALILRTDFDIGSDIKGSFMVILAVESMNKLLGRIRKKIKAVRGGGTAALEWGIIK